MSKKLIIIRGPMGVVRLKNALSQAVLLEGDWCWD